MRSFLGRRKNEMYFGYEKVDMSFEEFKEVVDKYIYYNNKRNSIQNKMDVSCCLQRNMAMLNSIQIYMCPGVWLHITFTLCFLFFINALIREFYSMLWDHVIIVIFK